MDDEAPVAPHGPTAALPAATSRFPQEVQAFRDICLDRVEGAIEWCREPDHLAQLQRLCVEIAPLRQAMTNLFKGGTSTDGRRAWRDAARRLEHAAVEYYKAAGCPTGYRQGDELADATKDFDRVALEAVRAAGDVVPHLEVRLEVGTSRAAAVSRAISQLPTADLELYREHGERLLKHLPLLFKQADAITLKLIHDAWLPRMIVFLRDIACNERDDLISLGLRGMPNCFDADGWVAFGVASGVPDADTRPVWQIKAVVQAKVVLANNGYSAAPVAAPPAPSRKGKRINERILARMQADPESMGWSAQRWATHLDCSKPTVINSKTWTDVLGPMGKVKKLKGPPRKVRRQGGNATDSG